MAVGAAAVLAVPLAAAPATAAPERAAQCAQRADRDEWLSCLGVTASLDRAPALGGTATLTVTVRSDAALSADVRIELPPQLTWTRAPQGLDVVRETTRQPERAGVLTVARTNHQFRAGEGLTLTGEVRAVKAGPAQIEARAVAPGQGQVHAGKDLVVLTVGEAGRPSRFGQADPGRAGVAAVPNAASVAPPARDRKRSVADRATLTTTACDTRVEGSFVYTDQGGVTRPSVNLTVEVWDADASGDQLLATGATSATGAYDICFDTQSESGAETGYADVYVTFVTSNPYYRVQRSGSPLTFTTSTIPDLPPTAIHDFGQLTSTDSTLQRGLHAYDAADDAWQWVPHPVNSCWDQTDTTCRQLIVNWAPDSTTGTYYSGQVWLTADAPDSATVVIHEIAHFVMDDEYDGAPPSAPNCNPHGVTTISSQGCAWVEGFAEWFPAMVLDDPYFRWPSGASVNLEANTWGTGGWDSGDAVEGRVAAAMIDVSDSTNEGPWDAYGEGTGNWWYTFTHHRAMTFSEFWANRTTDGFNVQNDGARGSLYQSTIDYQFCCVQLTPNTPVIRPQVATAQNYRFENSTSQPWQVVAVRAASQYELDLYDDPAQATLLDTSNATYGTDFLAIDSWYQPVNDYYPRVRPAGSGGYTIELAQSASSLATGTIGVPMGADNVVRVFNLDLLAGQTVTVSISGGASQDAELHLMGTAGSSDRVMDRLDALATASSGGPGATETLTYTAPVLGKYAVVVINQAGSGTYQLTVS